jgi:hypothetical protein
VKFLSEVSENRFRLGSIRSLRTSKTSSGDSDDRDDEALGNPPGGEPGRGGEGDPREKTR